MSTATQASSIKPLGDRVVAIQVEEADVTPSGIVLPDSAKEKPRKAKVIAVGEGRMTDTGQRIPMHVKVGDVVLHTSYGPTEVKHQGQEYLIMSESDILGIVME